MSVNLLDLDSEGLAAFVAGLEEKPFRARQVKRWMHRLGESDFARMSDIAKPLREKLLRAACVSPPRIVSDSSARDGTLKWLLDVWRRQRGRGGVHTRNQPGHLVHLHAGG